MVDLLDNSRQQSPRYFCERAVVYLPQERTVAICVLSPHVIITEAETCEKATATEVEVPPSFRTY